MGYAQISRSSLLNWAILVLPVLAVVLYLALIALPYPFFTHEAHFENIAVFSDRPISPALIPILADVTGRLRSSPLDDRSLQHRVFICNRNWLFTLFANTDSHGGGVNKAWLNQNIFLRRSDVEKNRLIGPSGREVPGERTLAYFITHEIAHSLEVHFLGRYAYLRLPVWKREGYADYVARRSEFVFAQRLVAFQRNVFEMDPKRSGLYLRYQLFVAYLLEQRHITPGKMLTGQFSGTAIDHDLRAIVQAGAYCRSMLHRVGCYVSQRPLALKPYPPRTREISAKSSLALDRGI